MILWSFVGFILVIWVAKLQRDHIRGLEQRREQQRRQRIGLAPIQGADGQPRQHPNPEAEEGRLLAILRERGGRAKDEN